MNRTISRVAAAATLLLGVLLVACQAQQAAPTAAPAPATQAPAVAPATQAPAAATQPPAAAPTAAPSVLKIGLVHSVSGPAAVPGARVQNANLLAIADYNAKGGLKVGGKTYRVEAVTADDASTLEGGRQACDRLLLAEKVKLVVAGPLPAPVNGCLTVADTMDAVVSVSSGTNVGPSHPNSFATGSVNSWPAYVALIQWLVKTHPQVKSVSYMATDDASGKMEAEQGTLHIKNAGLTVAGVEMFPISTTDHSAVVTRVLMQKPDAILISGQIIGTPGFFGVMKALTEQSFKGVLLGRITNPNPAPAGPIVEGFGFPYLQDPDSPALPPMAKDVLNRYLQKYGGEKALVVDVTVFYNQAYVLLQAVEQAGTVDDGKKIAETLRAGKWDTTFGKLGFGGAKTLGIASALELPVFLGIVKGGKNVNTEMVPGTVP